MMAKQGVFHDGIIEITEQLDDVPTDAKVVVFF